MKSTISLNKINAVIKKNFRLNMASFIVTNLLAFIGSLLICRTAVGMVDKNLVQSAYNIDVTEEYVFGILFIVFVLGTINLLFLSLKMFKEIYSRRAADSFYSMPVTRAEYYAANVIFGLINIVFLFVTVIAVTVIFGKTPVLFDVKHNIIDLPMFFKHAVNMFSMLCYIFAGFILAAVMCGKRWQVVAIALISSASVTVLFSGMASYMNTIYGYNVEISNNSAGTFLALLNNGISAPMSVQCVFRLILAAVIFVTGYIAFKNRKAEIAEQSLSGKVVPVLIQMLICAGMFMAFSSFANKTEWQILIGICAGLITSCIYCAVFYKKLLTKYAAISCAAVCAVMSIFIICVDKVPQSCGYIDYVPSAEEIQSAEFEENGDNYAYAGNSLDYLDSLLYNLSYSDSDDVNVLKLESPEAIESVLKLHEKAVSDEVIEKYNAYINPDEDYYSEDNWYSFKLTYRLKNGKTVLRYYAVGCKDILDEYADFIRVDEVIEQKPPFDINKDSILFARIEEPDTETEEIYDYDYDEYTSDDFRVSYSEDSYFTLENYGEFFGLLKEDIKARDKYDAVLQDFGFYYLVYDKYTDNSQYIYFYYLADDVPAEAAEKIRKMTPKQAEEYIYKSHDGYIGETQIALNRKSDKNIVSYLETRGILK